MAKEKKSDKKPIEFYDHKDKERLNNPPVGKNNFVSLITFVKASAQTSFLLSSASDYIIWYCRNKDMIKSRQLFLSKEIGGIGALNYSNIESPDGKHWRRISLEERDYPEEIPTGWKVFSLDNLMGTRPPNPTDLGPYEFNGNIYNKDRNKCWKTDKEGLDNLAKKGRLVESGKGLYYKRYLNDFPVFPMTTNWTDTASSFMAEKIYVVQTTMKVVQRCLLMTTDPGDLCLDITCGSGTTAYVAEQWGRRWITCDTSRVAVTLAKQRLMTAMFDYYELAHPAEGVGSGFKYKTVPHITLKSIANNEPPAQETLYDQPFTDNKRSRVTGPFTVEAVPAPLVKPLYEIEQEQPADISVARSGETLRQSEWRDELLKTGIRGKNNQYILFSRVEALPGTRWLHADAETKPNDLGADTVREKNPPTFPPLQRGEDKGGLPERVVISFGPEHAPLEQKQVALAIEEAQRLVPRPKIIVFAAFQFDPEAARDIDETNWPGVTLLKAQMNADLLTEDLKKKRASNESFWLIGQPDITLRKASEKETKTLNPQSKIQNPKFHVVEVHGFDYYNTKTGVIESGSTDKIALWMLDTDYDGRSLFPRQVFFPMAGENEGWSRLAKNLKAEIDEGLIEAYHGTVSIPFETGDNKRVAVKIVDDRGIESLKIMEVIE